MKIFKPLILLFGGFIGIQTTQAQFTADFTYNLFDSCGFSEAIFIDQSGTSPSMQAQYFWDFGDNSVSTQQNPSHIYAGPGSYQVVHTVSVNGATFTSIDTINFVAFTPAISYSAAVNNSSCTGPYVINLTGNTNQPGVGNWQWAFQNQIIGSGPNLAYTVTTPGSYTFTALASGPNGCLASYDSTVFVGGGGLQVSASYQTLTSDCQASTIDLYSTVSGGTAPYTYQWGWFDFGASSLANPQQIMVLTSIDPTVYLTVTDANGCSGSTLLTVQNNSPSITAFASAIPSSACGQSCDGAVNVVATGTAGPYTFTMNNGSIQTGYQVQFTGLCPGNYLIDVSDPQGCTETVNATVVQDSLSSILVDVLISNNSCSQNLTCNSSVEVVASNGIGPYQYSLDFGTTFQSSNVFDSICPGTYVVLVQDSNGCETPYSFVVAGGQSLGVQSYEYYATCDSNATGGGNGSLIEVFAFGGTAPYTYLWSDGSTNQTLFNPPAGTYTVIVTDANGCTISETFVVPSNQCYTISGNVYVDVNSNCVYDSADYPIQAFVDLTATAGGPWLWIYDYTDSNGAYSISAPAGTYYFDINGYNVNNYTPLCPNANYSVTVDANNPNVTVDFFLTPPPPTQDLSINMYTPYTFTPGFPTYTTVQYCNDGTIPMSGSVVVEYDASLVWYQSGTTPSGYSITNNDVPTSHDSVNHILTYDFTNLLPGQCAYLDVDYETPINTGLMPGDPILIDATVNPIPGDVTPANNVTYLSKVITSSWDPNDKAVSPDGDITVDQNDHAYYIRFQNEGNGNATTVVVKDELDANLDLHSLRNVSASHDYILTVENDNTLVFTFNNIQLVPQSIDEELSQGYVAFTLSQDGDLPIGTVIENTAAIYFDFNPAIVTNTVENEIVEKTTGTINIQVKNALSVYPNPSIGNYQLSLHEMEIRNIRVYDLIGNVLLQLLDLDNEDAEIDLSKHNDGVYFVEVETAQGKAVQKLIKRSK